MYLLLFLPWQKHAAQTTHILQPFKTSLAAASFECWGLDRNFSWQRHPSLHLCCYSASQSTHLAAVHHAHFYPGPHRLAQSLRSRQSLTAPTKLKSIRRGKIPRGEKQHITCRALTVTSALPEAPLQQRKGKHTFILRSLSASISTSSLGAVLCLLFRQNLL